MTMMLDLNSGLIWEYRHPDVTAEHLGLLPSFVTLRDRRPVAEQIDHNYRHGGGWRPQPEFELRGSRKDGYRLHWTGRADPEDGPPPPDYPELARCEVRDELIVFFDSAWTAVVQKDDSFEVSRLD